MDETEQRAQMPSALDGYQQPPGYGATTHIAVHLGTLQAAYHALRSYQHGNAAPALAAAVADQIKAALPEGSVDG